jgi:hypothetical protein
MGARLAILACLILLAGCGKIIERHWNVATDDPNWLAGYHEGLDQGVDRGRDQVCDEILHYKPAMAHDLDENTEICGYEDQSEQPAKPKAK